MLIFGTVPVCVLLVCYFIGVGLVDRVHVTSYSFLAESPVDWLESVLLLAVPIHCSSKIYRCLASIGITDVAGCNAGSGVFSFSVGAFLGQLCRAISSALQQIGWLFQFGLQRRPCSVQIIASSFCDLGSVIERTLYLCGFCWTAIVYQSGGLLVGRWHRVNRWIGVQNVILSYSQDHLNQFEALNSSVIQTIIKRTRQLYRAYLRKHSKIGMVLDKEVVFQWTICGAAAPSLQYIYFEQAYRVFPDTGFGLLSRLLGSLDSFMSQSGSRLSLVVWYLPSWVLSGFFGRVSCLVSAQFVLQFRGCWIIDNSIFNLGSNASSSIVSIPLHSGGRCSCFCSGSRCFLVLGIQGFQCLANLDSGANLSRCYIGWRESVGSEFV